MTADEIKKKSYSRGLEGLGGYRWEFDESVYTELLVKEIVKWSEANGGLSSGPDEEGLREHLGLKPQ